MFRTRPIAPVAALFLLLLSGTVGVTAPAQTPQSARPAAKAAAPLTLARALALTRPGEAGVAALAVGAEKTRLPSGTKIAPADARRLSPAQAGRAFNRAVRRFDGVDALAPPTMVVLGIPPAHPNPWDGMPPGDVVKLLAGSFTPSQWQGLLSPRGIGLGDLTDDTQRDFFRALFPGNTLRVQFDVPGGANRKKDIQDVSALLPQARIRIGQQVSIGMPCRGKPDEHVFAMTLRADDAPKRYVQLGADGDRLNRVNGALVRNQTPNRPKPGQLDTEADVFQKAIPLANLRTVGDLVARIAKTTSVELYADHRYEGKTVTFAGAAETASANGLLRALAFCVTGTYRKVGPSAWVLTDDVMGVGTRRQLWSDFEKEGDAARKQVLDKAGDAIYQTQPAPDIVPLADPLAFNSAQRELSAKKRADDLKNYQLSRGGMQSVELPLNQLTPAQQASARRIHAAYASENEMSLEGTFILQSEAQAELILPGFDGPVTLNFDIHGVFEPSMRVRSQIIDAAQKEAAPAAAARRRPQPRPAPETFPDLARTLHKVPRRAVFARPETDAEVDALLGSMKTLGLNELWLQTFSDPTGANLSDALFTHAIDAAQKQGGGIRVFAVLDLLMWKTDIAAAAGTPAPATEVRDLDLRGETSEQAEARMKAAFRFAYGQQARAFSPIETAPSQTIVVSPFAPDTFSTLQAVLQKTLKTPGLAGVVWRETIPPGYKAAEAIHYVSDTDLPGMGYTETARVAFLRRAHSDPLDIFPSEYRDGHANTTLPNLDDFELDRALNNQWDDFRRNARAAFLHKLAHVVPPQTPLLMEVRSAGGRNNEAAWYGSWDNRDNPPPQVRLMFATADEFQREEAQAHAQSKTAFVVAPLWPQMPGPFFAQDLVRLFDKTRWNGVLIDTVNIPRWRFGYADEASAKAAAQAEEKNKHKNPLETLTLPWTPPPSWDEAPPTPSL